MSERPPAVDDGDDDLHIPWERSGEDCVLMTKAKYQSLLADLKATRRERDELIEQADKVYLLLQSAVAKAAHAAQRPY